MCASSRTWISIWDWFPRISLAWCADAGIPHYWIVDLDEPVSLLDCHLAEDFGYADFGAITGTVTLSAPFSVRLVLDVLI